MRPAGICSGMYASQHLDGPAVIAAKNKVPPFGMTGFTCSDRPRPRIVEIPGVYLTDNGTLILSFGWNSLTVAQSASQGG